MILGIILFGSVGVLLYIWGKGMDEATFGITDLKKLEKSCDNCAYNCKSCPVIKKKQLKENQLKENQYTL